MLFKEINKVGNGRVIMKDESRDVLQRKIDRLRQYANQCRITGDLEEYREALKEIANLEEEFKNLMKNLPIKDAAAVALDQIRKLKRSMAEDTALGALDSLKKDVKRNTKDQDNEKIEGYGVKGNNNDKWRRIFSNRAEMMKWVESNNAEIQGTRKAEPNERVGNVDKKTKDELYDVTLNLKGENHYYHNIDAPTPDVARTKCVSSLELKAGKVKGSLQNEFDGSKNNVEVRKQMRDAAIIPQAVMNMRSRNAELKKELEKARKEGDKASETFFLEAIKENEDAEKRYMSNRDSKTKDAMIKYKGFSIVEDMNGLFMVLKDVGKYYTIERSLEAAKDWIDDYLKQTGQSNDSKQLMKDAALVALKGLDEVRKQMKDRKTKDDVLISHYKGYMITTNGNKFQATNTVRQIDAFSKEELYRKVDDIEEKRAKMREINRRNADSKTKDINPPSDSERIKNDFESGRKDHNAGYYDKWYRWNRKDNGRAYDDGFNSVAGKPVQIIEAMHDSKTKDVESPVGKHNNIPDDQFDPKELEQGIKVEMEHTNDLDLAKSIAKDHLMEIKDYYTRLLKMEEEAKNEK